MRFKAEINVDGSEIARLCMGSMPVKVCHALNNSISCSSCLICIRMCVVVHEKSKIPFSYMLYAYSVKRAYRGTKPKESFR